MKYFFSWRDWLTEEYVIVSKKTKTNIGIGASIRIGREIQFIPWLGFFSSTSLVHVYKEWHNNLFFKYFLGLDYDIFYLVLFPEAPHLPFVCLSCFGQLEGPKWPAEYQFKEHSKTANTQKKTPFTEMVIPNMIQNLVKSSVITQKYNSGQPEGQSQKKLYKEAVSSSVLIKQIVLVFFAGPKRGRPTGGF